MFTASQSSDRVTGKVMISAQQSCIIFRVKQNKLFPGVHVAIYTRSWNITVRARQPTFNASGSQILISASLDNANMACWYGRRWAEMQRSSHSMVRRVACSKRVSFVLAELTTSSSAIKISAPILFCMFMDRSGVRNSCLPSTGDWKATPSSCHIKSLLETLLSKHQTRLLFTTQKARKRWEAFKVWSLATISARSSRLTIWKPPLSVSVPRFQFMKAGSPLNISKISDPGRFSRW